MKSSLLSKLRRPAAVIGSISASAVLLLGLAACAPAAEPDLKTDATEISIEDWRTQMDDCMLEAGFDIRPEMGEDGEPSNSLDISQFDMELFDAAYAKCTKKVGEAPVDANQPTADQMFDTQLAFAQCMRAKGYDYPDPVKGSGGMSEAMDTSTTNPDDIDACFAKAEEEVAQ